jgi:hypothetical protein
MGLRTDVGRTLNPERGRVSLGVRRCAGPARGLRARRNPVSSQVVEAAGVEPAPPQNANRLMARDFRRNCLEIRCLVVNSLCSGVLWSAPLSWRHCGDGGPRARWGGVCPFVALRPFAKAATHPPARRATRSQPGFPEAPIPLDPAYALLRE